MRTDRSPRIIRAEEHFEAQNKVAPSENCAMLRLEDLRNYLIERRRAIMTELHALDCLLKTE